MFTQLPFFFVRRYTQEAPSHRIRSRHVHFLQTFNPAANHMGREVKPECNSPLNVFFFLPGICLFNNAALKRGLCTS